MAGEQLGPAAAVVVAESVQQLSHELFCAVVVGGVAVVAVAQCILRLFSWE